LTFAIDFLIQIRISRILRKIDRMGIIFFTEWEWDTWLNALQKEKEPLSISGSGLLRR